MNTRVFITSSQSGPNAWQAIEKRLRELYELSNKQYELVDDPDAADIILIGIERADDWGLSLLDNETIGKSPDKSFSIHDAGYPIFLHHGVYSSTRNSMLSHGRVRTGSYTLYNKRLWNPFVQSHVVSDADFREKEFLFSFVGRQSHPVRRQLFELTFHRPDILILDSSAFNLWSDDFNKTDASARHYHYYRSLLKSKFSLCPRGTGTGSMRLFESMQLGVAPVIIADGWDYPVGPRWSEFSIGVKEKHIRELERIIESHEGSYELMGRAARTAYDTHFAEDVYFNYIVESCLDIMRSQPIPETIYWQLRAPILSAIRAKNSLRLKSRMKGLVGSLAPRFRAS
jgi:hypothetical protein